MRVSKDSRKKLSVFFQIFVLAACCAWVVRHITHTGEPPTFNRDEWTQRDGFVAIAYGALAKDKHPRLNSRPQFEEHVQALKEAGYNCITSKDVVDFYVNKKPLPEKALYIMFEGGRKDSAIFGQDILSETHAHATFFTYTETLNKFGHFFVSPFQLKSIAQSGFWDIGSQGYNFSQLAAYEEGQPPSPYLCDFARSSDGSVETREGMTKRLGEFYQESYGPLEKILDNTPIPYVFMPANAFHKMPSEVEEANKKYIREYFHMAFTRSGSAFNPAGGDIYDLSRMQVNPMWSSEDLLHALRSWNVQCVGFKASSPESSKEWFLDPAELRVENNSIVITPEENSTVPAFLRGSDLWSNLTLSTVLEKDDGERAIYLRYTSKESYLRILLSGNRVMVHERLPGKGLVSTFDSVLKTDGPWHFEIILKSNRLKLSVNGSDLSRSLLPVSPDLQKGSLALGARGLPGYQAVFGEIETALIPSAWCMREAETATSGDARGHIATASIIPLPEPIEDSQTALRRLLQARGAGELAVAALPSGDLAFSMERLILAPLEESYTRQLWQGILIEPLPSSSWEQVNRAVRGIQKEGFTAVVKLSLDSARSLIHSRVELQADWFVFDFAPIDLSASQAVELANKHNRNYFLYADGRKSEETGWYTDRREE